MAMTEGPTPPPEPACAPASAARGTPEPERRSAVRRTLYLVGGFSFVGLAWLGVLLPVLPTTPFLLLALWCFSRSSPRLRDWLLRSRIFGPFLRDWHTHRGVRRGTKVLALIAVGAVVVASLVTGGLSPVLRGILLALAAIGLTVIARLRTIPSGTPPSRALGASGEQSGSGAT